MPSREEVVDTLHQVEDPELGMDIVDLGLLYEVEVEDSKAKVLYSLTSMGCPAGPLIAQDIDSAARQVEGIEIMATSRVLVDDTGVRQLGGLASELAKQTAEKAQKQQDTVLADAQQLSLDRLYKLPPLETGPPPLVANPPATGDASDPH